MGLWNFGVIFFLGLTLWSSQAIPELRNVFALAAFVTLGVGLCVGQRSDGDQK